MAYGLASGTSTSSFGAALTGAAYIELGGIVFLISRIAQIIDIFGVIDEARKAGRIADVAPVIDVDIQRTSIEMRVSLEY